MRKDGVIVWLGLALVGSLILGGCDGDDGDEVFRTIPEAVRPGTIIGQVFRGDTQRPQPGMMVEVSSPEQITTTETDANGRFQVTNLGVTEDAGYLVTIRDRRTVGTDAGQIPPEQNRLATVRLRASITVTSGNTQRVNNLGRIYLNPTSSIRATVRLVDGSLAPAGVRVQAVPVAIANACTEDGNATVPDFGFFRAETGGNGVATFEELDPCIRYMITVPAQVVGNEQQSTVTLPASCCSVFGGDTEVTFRLFPVDLSNTPLAVVDSNMAFNPEFETARDEVTPPPGASAGFFSASQNAHNSGFDFAMSNPRASDVRYTAPSGTRDLMIVFNTPVDDDMDMLDMIALQFMNELVDPDADDDGTRDDDVGFVSALGGVTASLDESRTMLTITHTTAPLVANQFYTVAGNVRQSGADDLTDLRPLLGYIYTSDASAAYGDLSMATADNNIIEADNRSGNAGAGPGAVYLVFREAVAGTVRVVSVRTGDTTLPISDDGEELAPFEMTRLVSTNGDPTASTPAEEDTCSNCLGGVPETDTDARVPPMADTEPRVRAIIGLPDMPDLSRSNGDLITVDLDVVDVQGNRFNGELTLPVD